MNYKNNLKYRRALARSSRQDGAAILGTVLVLLVIASLVGFAASKSTILETKMVFNMQDKQRSSSAADSAALYAWNEIKKDFSHESFIKNSNQPGYYVLTNDIPASTETEKLPDHWNAIETVATWPWEDDTKRFSFAEPLGGTANPMKLISTPQYTAGIHNAAFRKGTANYKCIPVSIIGAGQGGTAQTKTLIELKAIPKSGCYHKKIK